jgi:hypothetical protein
MSWYVIKTAARTHVVKGVGVLMASRNPQRPRAMFSRCLMCFYLRGIHRALVRIIYSMAQQSRFWERYRANLHVLGGIRSM